jgi:hypothetical protein
MTHQQLAELVVAQQRELGAIRAQQEQTAIGAAIAGALGSAGVELNPGVQGQLVALLRPDVSLVNHGGTTIPAGPGLKPVDQFVRERLASPEFAHFVRGRAVNQGQANQGGIPTPGAPGESLGAAVIRHAVGQRAEREARFGDAQTDMGRSFGLKARSS